MSTTTLHMMVELVSGDSSMIRLLACILGELEISVQGMNCIEDIGIKLVVKNVGNLIDSISTGLLCSVSDNRTED